MLSQLRKTVTGRGNEPRGSNRPTTVVHAACIYEGWLLKRGPDARYGWENRWCALSEDSLTYYTDETMKEKKGKLALTGSAASIPFDSEACPGDGIKYRSEQPFGFVLDPEGPNCKDPKKRVLYYFAAEDQEQLQEWLGAVPMAAERIGVVECFKVDGRYEVTSVAVMRAGESLDSEKVCEIEPGTVVTIVELGTVSRRRAKVTCKDGEGWLSMATSLGQRLLADVGSSGGSPSARSRGSNARGSTRSLQANDTSQIKIILESARAGDLDAIVQVMTSSTTNSKPNLNCSDIRGKTPLIYAAAFGRTEIVKYLLGKSEVDVNAMDDTRKNAIHHASKRATKLREGANDEVQATIVQMIIEAKGFVEARDHNGCTPLTFAVANGHEAVVRTLIAAQSSVNVTDYEGNTPLDYATNFGHSHLVAILKNAGARGGNLDDDSDYSDEETELQAIPDEEGGGGESDGEAAASASTAAPESTADDSTSPTAKKKVPKKSVKSADGETSPKKAAKKKAKPKPPGEGAAEGEAKPKKVAKKKAKPKDASKDEDGGAVTKTKSATAKKAAKKAAAAPKDGMKAMAEQQAAAEKAEVEETAIAVEVVVDKHDKEKQAAERAKQKLIYVMDHTPDVRELEVAIETAVEAGAPEEIVKKAQQCLADLRSRTDARGALLQATEAKDVPWLKEAIAAAEKAGIKNKDLQNAKKILAEEEPREECRKALKAACDKGDMEALKKAIAESKKKKLDPDELSSYEELLASGENKEKAQQALADALRDLDVAALKVVIPQAKGVGLDTSEAEAVLKREEPKQKARELLEIAITSGDTGKMTAAIEEAKRAGLDKKEWQDCEAQIQREADKVKFFEEVKQVMEESMSVNTSKIDDMKAAKEKLSVAIAKAKEAGVEEKKLADAELRRRKIHNGIEDLKGSIRVFCRIRPLSKKELGQGDINVATQVDAISVAISEDPASTKKDHAHTFSFDAVFLPGTQEEVFEDCRDLVQSACDGYNVTMFAYGQSGAGKTFTMYGVPGQEGTSPRTITELFRVIDMTKDRYTYTIMGSMLELYRSDLVDLLAGGRANKSAPKLNVRLDKQGGVTVEHLREEECKDAKELTNLLDRGNKERSVSATNLNAESSRSHLVLMIKVISVNKETGKKMSGKILICDLAGSERLGKSQTTGEAQKESIEINKSLTALGDVIESLTKGAKQIPYRNHKLTQLMQDALGGTAKTLMFVNCSPAVSNVTETIQSLKYATRAKQITNKTAKAKAQE
eukprot:TRINITY_DN121566_c0_g1_i1.p1 TRINITY_DN121566_c0_g1~~TRINITY_DN121566_c0_g1_i1.p1  ORF type:complete len:1258 (-),score=423.49 TRINITY_DN121566_c0_g1_i1:595-4368(-)